jgi:hypothetical protein
MPRPDVETPPRGIGGAGKAGVQRRADEAKNTMIGTTVDHRAASLRRQAIGQIGGVA